MPVIAPLVAYGLSGSLFRLYNILQFYVKNDFTSKKKKTRPERKTAFRKAWFFLRGKYAVSLKY